MFRQRKEYKGKKRKKSPPGEGKRSITKVKKEVEELSELVGLMDRDNNGSVNVSEANANPMGGRNSRQASVRREADNASSSNNQDVIKIKTQLKSELNISSLTISVEKSSTNTHEIKEHPAGTRV